MYNKRTFLILIIYFLILIILAILTHHTFLGVQDEAQLYATLKNGEPINYMTSYPFALFVSYLYKHFQNMQWYSIFMTFYIIIISTILALYISIINFSNKYINYLIKFLLLILATLLIFYMLLEVDVTSPTLILIVLAIPFTRINQVYFWLIVWVASFLREQIIFSLIPLLGLAYIIAINKESLKNKRRLILSSIFIIGILFNHFSYKLNPTYDKWMEFTEKRAYFTDFGGAPINGILTKDEFHLARTWWIVDQDLYPYKKVMADAGGTLDIIKQRLYHKSIKNYFISIVEHHKILYIFFIVSIIVSILYRNWIKLFAYLSFGLIFIVLLFVKDVERVTVPMYLMWCSMIITDIWYLYIKKRSTWFVSTLIPVIIIWLSYTIYNILPKYKITQFNKTENMVKELKHLLNKNKNMSLELTSGFPASWTYLIKTIKQNHLFDEKNWIDYDNDLLLQGWFSRVPLVYKQHNISFNGVKRKYEHYHDWLIQPTSGILGSKGESRHIRPFLKQNLMRLYDEKFPRKNCFHTTLTVDESKHFIIHRVAQVCSDKINKDNEIWNIFENNNSVFRNLKLKNKVLTATNNDPQILVRSDKVKSKYCLLDIVVESNNSTFLQVFYKNSANSSYNENNAHTKKLNKGYNHIQFILPAKLIKNTLRIDPVSKKGKYKIRKLSIYEYNL